MLQYHWGQIKTIEEMEADICVNSQENVGTEFVFTFQIKQ